jgi:spore coat polysaccharide biosynthesis predicted glycosyltransferase SpsG
VIGNSRVGLGHVYNTLLVANDILDHKITFLVNKGSELAYDKISSKNYPVYIQKNENILDDICSLSPDVVINDRLDSSEEYISSLKEQGYKVVNFEDLGEGAKKADLIINAIYPEKQAMKNHYFGYNYFILRDEFIYSNKKKVLNDVNSVLLAFGGVDPNNYTLKIIEIIYNYCQNNNIKITVVAGFGYDEYKSLERYSGINIKKNVANISKYIYESDLIFTSAGRTTYEVASICSPAIVLAQNEREMTHSFASSEYGFLNLGLGYNLKKGEVYNNFIGLVESYENRKHMGELMNRINLKNGRKEVNRLIKKLIERI